MVAHKRHFEFMRDNKIYYFGVPVEGHECAYTHCMPTLRKPRHHQTQGCTKHWDVKHPVIENCKSQASTLPEKWDSATVSSEDCNNIPLVHGTSTGPLQCTKQLVWESSASTKLVLPERCTRWANTIRKMRRKCIRENTWRANMCGNLQICSLRMVNSQKIVRDVFCCAALAVEWALLNANACVKTTWEVAA